ncbi:hypothetical protein LINGRAHAP2_LOCUS14318 [Linum grandiflorum]
MQLCPGANATCPICKKSDAPVRGTCSIHSRSASDHGVDGAVETGNEHLPHVPRRGVNNSTGRCALDGLINVSGDALYVGYEKETNWAAIVEEVLGKAFLMPDRSSAYVHCQYLLAFRERRPFAWGAAVLS